MSYSRAWCEVNLQMEAAIHRKKWEQKERANDWKSRIETISPLPVKVIEGKAIAMNKIIPSLRTIDCKCWLLRRFLATHNVLHYSSNWAWYIFINARSSDMSASSRLSAELVDIDTEIAKIDELLTTLKSKRRKLVEKKQQVVILIVSLDQSAIYLFICRSSSFIIFTHSC